MNRAPRKGLGNLRVSSPQVDLTRYGLDKTPTLFTLWSRGTPPPQ